MDNNVCEVALQCCLWSLSWVISDLPVEDKDQIRSGVVRNIHILHLHDITFLWHYEELCVYFFGTWSPAGTETLCVLQRPSLCQTHGGLMGWPRWPNTHFHVTWETFHRLTGRHHNSGGIWQRASHGAGRWAPGSLYWARANAVFHVFSAKHRSK